MYSAAGTRDGCRLELGELGRPGVLDLGDAFIIELEHRGKQADTPAVTDTYVAVDAHDRLHLPGLVGNLAVQLPTSGHDRLGSVCGEHAAQLAGAVVARNERPARVSDGLDDDPISCVERSDALVADGVLLGPEIWQRPERRWLTENAGRGRLSVVASHLPVLHDGNDASV